ncbi:unnamed protein product [Mytilus coruscus]|uniref:TRAM domain-containing protein n=1 Tax=Mytilus coruscus TaxID=42192 RepID=A0A6J8A1G7_MYTCO|nr:unnamed protein product [Mytilus coruscus]
MTSYPGVVNVNTAVQIFIYQLIVVNLVKHEKATAASMGHTKKGFVSVLMQKDLKKMEKFNWNEIVNEFLHKFPTVFKLIIGIMLPESENYKQLISCLPRIGLLYSLILQARHPGLSLIQRTVYDRLQAIGVTLSYQKTLYVLDILGGSFNTAAIEAVTNKKTLRIIGDNVNFKTSITEQHNSNDGKRFEMHHAFAKQTTVIPLETKPLNEQKYEDVVKILEHYENVIDELHQKANADLKDEDCFHIGDLLDEYLFKPNSEMHCCTTGIHDSRDVHHEDVIEEASVITITLSDGKTVEIQIQKDAKKGKIVEKTDGILNYATLVLNLAEASVITITLSDGKTVEIQIQKDAKKGKIVEKTDGI